MFRVGFGYDSHRFGEGDQVMLGGVAVPHDKGVVAHSDGDVILHALVDAILGALALGDIGQHFPDSDPTFKNASSSDFLKQAQTLALARGYHITNIDCTVIAQAPTLAPYISAMRHHIAEVLSIAKSHVSVKATTNEKMGWIGRGEGLAAQVVVMVSTHENHVGQAP